MILLQEHQKAYQIETFLLHAQEFADDFLSKICVKKVFVYISILPAFLFLSLFLFLLSFRFRGCWRCLLKEKQKRKNFFAKKRGQNSVHNLLFFLTFFDRVGESGGASDENDLDLPAVQSGFFF